jgi:hypothetical protein
MKNSSAMNGVVGHPPRAVKDPPKLGATSAGQDQRDSTMRAG